MPQSKKLWQTLKIGDKIRFTEIPSEFLQPGYYIHRDTMAVYKKLLRRGRSLRVAEIDDWGSPWIRCQFRRKDGRIEYHSLSINHDGFIKVIPRKRKDQ